MNARTGPTMIRVKRVYEPQASQDDVRDAEHKNAVALQRYLEAKINQAN